MKVNEMNDQKKFNEFVQSNILSIGYDRDFIGLSNIWVRESINHNYAQNFIWLGRPVIQVPTDIYAIQELVWKIKPDLILETGIARGGSLILSASLLALLDYSEAIEQGLIFDPSKSQRKVLGIDIDIRAHNRKAIERHPMAHLIKMIEGSSIDKAVIDQVNTFASNYKRVLVFLDSNHTHDHVLAELEAYAPLVSQDSYCVVWDTGVEDLPDGFVTNRPWGKGNNPKTAVFAYLEKLENTCIQANDGNRLLFEIDKMIEHKIAITASPDGFLRRRDL